MRERGLNRRARCFRSVGKRLGGCVGRARTVRWWRRVRSPLSDLHTTADQMQRVGIMRGLRLNRPKECQQCSGHPEVSSLSGRWAEWQSVIGFLQLKRGSSPPYMPNAHPTSSFTPLILINIPALWPGRKLGFCLRWPCVHPCGGGWRPPGSTGRLPRHCEK